MSQHIPTNGSTGASSCTMSTDPKCQIVVDAQRCTETGVQVEFWMGNSTHHAIFEQNGSTDMTMYDCAPLATPYSVNAIQLTAAPTYAPITYQWACNLALTETFTGDGDVMPWHQGCQGEAGLPYDKIYIYYKGGREYNSSDIQTQYWGIMTWLENQGWVDPTTGQYTPQAGDVYHTIIGGGGERWLDWATSAYTAVLNNSGTEHNWPGGPNQANGDVDVTGWDEHGSSYAAGATGDTIDWSHNTSAVYNFYASTTSGLSTSGTTSGNTITSLGLPPIAANTDDVLIIILNDDSDCCYHGAKAVTDSTINGTLYEDCIHFNGQCGGWGDQVDDGFVQAWKSDYTFHTSTLSAHTGGGGTHNGVNWPTMPAGDMSSPKDNSYILHVAASISSGNQTVPDGTFTAGCAKYHPTISNGMWDPAGLPTFNMPPGALSNGTPCIRALELSNPYVTGGAGMLDQQGWTFPKLFGGSEFYIYSSPGTITQPGLPGGTYDIPPFETQLQETLEHDFNINTISNCDPPVDCITVLAKNPIDGTLAVGYPITLMGPSPSTQYTNGSGYAFFPALDPGTYDLMCTNIGALNGNCYEYLYTLDVYSCTFTPDKVCVCGCDDPAANNYDPSADYYDPNECPCTYDTYGCTDPTACNYDPLATMDDGSCCYPGCMDPNAPNYNSAACCDDGSCEELPPCDIAYGENDPGEHLTDDDVKRIETEARFADDVYKHFQARRFGMISPCENTLDGIASEKYLCYWQDKKEKEYTGYKIEREVFKPLEPGTPPAPGTFPNWVDPLCGLIPRGDLTIYFYYDGTSMGQVQAQNIHTAAELWIQQLQGDGFTGNHYHTIISGERWLDWPIQAITGGWNNSGNFTSDTLVCSTNSAVTACNTPARFCGAASVNMNVGATGECQCHGDTVTPGARMGMTAQVQDWAQNSDCEVFFYDSHTKGVQCDTWQNTAPNVYIPEGPSITWNGPPPPCSTEQVLIVVFADESQTHNNVVNNDPYYYSYHQSGSVSGNASDWGLASQNGPADVFKADYNFYIDTYNEFTSRSCNHQMNCYMYPIRPGNGPWSSHRPFPLSTLGPISSGNRPTPDGTFLAGTAPVNTVGTLLAAEIPGSNIYWNEPNTVTQHAFGYGGLDHYGWGGNFTSPSVTPTLDPNVLVSDLNNFFVLGLYQCNDTECLVFDVVNQNGNSIEGYQIYIDGKDVGKTNEFGRYTHIISQASINTEHTAQICDCFTTSGDCAQQRLLITATELCLEPECTVPDPQCTCNAPGNLQVAPGTGGTDVKLTWTATNSSETTITYDIRYRAVNTTTPNTWIEITGVTGTVYILTGLSPVTDYEFQVRSICDILTSDWNANQIFTTLNPCPIIECMLATCNSLTSYNLIYQYSSIGALTTANTGTWGIVWGTNADITLDNIVAGGSTSTIMVPATPSTYPGEAVVNTLITEIATGLAGNTQYYWRAYLLDHNIAGCGSNPIYSDICEFVSIADVCDIPDNNFEQALMDLGHKPQGAYTGTIPMADVNTITTLNVSSYNIADLTGIECFIALTHLECQTNVLTSLNISSNTLLTFLNCDNNQLTALNTTANTALLTLHCDNNAITSVNLTTNIALTDLYVWENQLTSLDLTVNIDLTFVACDFNNITTLDLTTLTALTTLRCHDNPPLSFLDVTNGNNINMPAAHFQTANTPLLTCISCDDAVGYATPTWTVGAGCIDAGDTFGSPCVPATYCNIPDANFFAALQAAHPGFTYVGTTVLDTDVAALTVLNLQSTTSPNPNGIADMTGIECFTGLQILNISDNQITSLNLQSNTALTQLSCGTNQISSIDVTQNVNLTSLTAFNNLLTTIDVSNNTALTDLWVQNNQLTTIDVTLLPLMQNLQVNSNQLTSLDVSSNPVLESLWSGLNLYTTIDVSNNVSLKNLGVSNTLITSIDLSLNIILETLQIFSNDITCIDLSNNPALDTLQAHDNPVLETLNVANGGNTNIITAQWMTNNTPLLTCITVDDIAYSNANWTTIDAANTFNTFCSPIDCTVPLCHVPDGPFRARLSAVYGLVFDANNETPISGMTPITNFHFPWTGGTGKIQDLTGIECMPNLVTLQVQAHNITGHVDLSNNPLLEIVYLYENYNITSLDITQNTALKELKAWLNGLTTLDVSNNVLLEFLMVQNNSLTALNTTGLTTLDMLMISDNPITSIDLSTNVGVGILECHDTLIDKIDMSMCPTGSELECQNNPNLTCVNFATGQNVCCTNLTLFDINFTNNPLLTSITVDDAAAVIYCTANWTFAIDPGTVFTEVDTCLWTYIPDANFQTHLTGIGKTFVGDYVLTSTIITVTGLNLNSLGVTDLTGLEDFAGLIDLWISHNTGITSVDLSGNPLLESFHMQGCTGITTIDVSMLPSLDIFDSQWCTGIASVDLSNNPLMVKIWVKDMGATFTTFNMKNGNNTNVTPASTEFLCTGNPSLTSINCDDIVYAAANFTNIDATMTTWTAI